MTREISFKWKGMELTVFYDEDGEIVSVTNQKNDGFLDLLTDFKMNELQDDFDWKMSECSDDNQNVNCHKCNELIRCDIDTCYRCGYNLK